ncbi:MAG: hypothetical protein PUJ57_03830 [Peptoniphilaceae bacterium]|nr:hypothetical protein [Peptoniphilaceae bacterium]MDY6085184.1 hypothetical protein [Peptoniphilaceae bacterium]
MESSSGSKKPEGLASRFFLMSFWGRLSGDGDAIGIDLVQNNIIRISTSIFDEFEVVI